MRKYFNIPKKIALIVLLPAVFLAENSKVGSQPSLRKTGSDSELNLTQTLNKCWEYEFARTEADTNIIASDNVTKLVFSTDNGKLKFLDTTLAEPLWATDLGSKVISDFIFENDSIYFVTAQNTGGGIGNYSLKSINTLGGLVKWQIGLQLHFEIQRQSSVNISVSGEKIIVIGRDGVIYVINRSDGREISRQRINANPSGISYVSDKYIIVAASNNKILFVSTDGKILNELSAKDKVSALVLSDENRLIYGDKRGTVYSVDISNSSPLWKFRSGAEITDITKTNNGILISSNDNFIYLIDADNGKLIWKRRMPGRISGKPFLFGEYAIAGSLAQPEADVIDLKSGKIVNRLFLDADSYLTGHIFIQNNLLILSTLKSLNAFGSGEC